MKFLKKLKSSNFWVSMISAVVLILQAVFNVEIKTEYLTQIIMAILGLLVMSGIVTDTASGEVVVNQKTDTDSIKNGVMEIFSQAMLGFQSSVETIIKQLETPNKEVNIQENSNLEKEDAQTTTEPKIDNENNIPSVLVEPVKLNEMPTQKTESNDIL